ncbi:hypothetical protein F5Y04DRAFT_121175 [Hypomontagnella monticulosa]|nr:hypothetical protein F5Y04DRAFT_121175 [Hypomontagnella monticulosa]
MFTPLSSLSAREENIFDGPAGPPPEGITPNFVDPPNKTAASYAVTSICMAITTFLVVIRIYAKAYCLRDIRIPDVFAFIAYGLYCGFIYSLLDCIHNAGFFIDIWNYQLKNLPLYTQPNYAITILYPLVLAFLKSAILLDWCRIFVPFGTRNYFWWTCHALVVLNASFYLAMFFGWAFSCSPVEKFWIPWVDGTCVNMLVLDIINGSLNLMTDIAAFLLPQRMIWNLNLPTKKRVGVSTIFAIGIIACIIAAIRINYCIRLYLSNSLTYDLSALDLWNLGEMTCGFIIFCAPSTLVAYSRVSNIMIFPALKSWFSSFSSKSRSEKGKSERSWPSSAFTESNAGRDYRQINGSNGGGMANAKFGHISTLPLDELQQFETTTDRAPILRTIDFTVLEGYDDQGCDEQYRRQHPWATEPRRYQSHV